jgi:CheY-like chemotaxis protein
MSGVVVYIDDEPFLCRAFALLLKRAAIACATFDQPSAALSFLRQQPVALVFCDYRLPAMTGLALLAQLEQPPPFYLVSGEVDAERWLALDRRVSGVLAKPFAAAELLRIIRQHLPTDRA